MKNKLGLMFCSVFVIIFMSLTLTTCDLLDSLLSGEEGEEVFTPSIEQMVSALKEALRTGSNEAGDTLSAVDAFNKNPVRRIPLPPEVDTLMATLGAVNPINVFGVASISPVTIITAIGGQTALDDLKNKINKAAEEASKQVGGIFGNAVMSMTFDDAKAILLGKDTEATDYFRATTTAPLIAAFKPVLDAALGTPFINTVSASSAWSGIVTPYNKFAQDYNSAVTNPLVIFALGQERKTLDIVNTDLSEFVLEKALKAVFDEIAEMEKKIRVDPLKFVTDLFSDISAKVFDWAKQLIL